VDVVIFGIGKFASLAWYVITHDSNHRVVGFTVDGDYCTEETFHGLRTVPFENLERYFPPDNVAMLLPLGGHNINGLRASRYIAAKERGYGFVTYIASRAMVWPDLQIGENCMIFDGSIVNPFAVIGNNCILRDGSVVSHHANISDHCFLAAHAVVAGSTKVGERCFLGLNSTIRNGLTLAPKCFVAAGAVVVADTIENGVYVGVPARRREIAADQFEAS
jgi:sugar O-acyltransferase (sialic acid O-acetyltransferase NeuD family)